MTKESIAKPPQRRTSRATLGTRQILSVSGKDPEFHYRVVNDDGDRVNQLLDLGYVIEEAGAVRVGDKRVGNPTPTGSKAEVSVGRGMKAYVMKQRLDWYLEDQAAKQEQVKKSEDATKAEAINNGSDYGSLKLPGDR